MFAYLVILHLTPDAAPVYVYANDCSAGRVWLQRANAWAERSHLAKINGPHYSCGPYGENNMTTQAGLEPIPAKERQCRHPYHKKPARPVSIPPGYRYKVVCPSCSLVSYLYQNQGGFTI
jgi:hypothetical protein